MGADTALGTETGGVGHPPGTASSRAGRGGLGGCRKSWPGVEQEKSSQLAACEASGSHLMSSLEVMFKGWLSGVEWNKLAEDALHYCAPNWISYLFRQFFGDDLGSPTPVVQ